MKLFHQIISSALLIYIGGIFFSDYPLSVPHEKDAALSKAILLSKSNPPADPSAKSRTLQSFHRIWKPVFFAVEQKRIRNPFNIPTLNQADDWVHYENDFKFSVFHPPDKILNQVFFTKELKHKNKLIKDEKIYIDTAVPDAACTIA
jgi:hypothetical protein